jgi:hypothetical protein
MSEVKAAQEAENKRNGKPNFKNGKKQGIKPEQTQSLNSDAAVPMLRLEQETTLTCSKEKSP